MEFFLMKVDQYCISPQKVAPTTAHFHKSTTILTLNHIGCLDAFFATGLERLINVKGKNACNKI